MTIVDSRRLRDVIDRRETVAEIEDQLGPTATPADAVTVRAFALWLEHHERDDLTGDQAAALATFTAGAGNGRAVVLAFAPDELT